VVCVVDTGVGISPDDLPHIFDRFWRARETTAKGAGLGLSIARGIIDAHGGKIWAESKLGAGTTMTFTLPLAPAPH
jgi:signal transduction histidine kinase